ncbi:MAG TPA: alkaline phosphatase family protein [Candidatus Norongarragalinales archaeon]|nr:alkaline phosphatase family protein [Candidatus Norongarragalinales archaeon]
MFELKTLVIGFDGGTWTVLDHLIAKGRMPTLKKIKEKGAWGILKSTIPPVTCPAWPSMSTGKNAAKHGVLNFEMFQFPNYTFRIATSNDFKVKTHYEILDDHELRSILINLPGLYPAKKISGIIITDILTQNEAKMVYPQEIREKYKEAFDGDAGKNEKPYTIFYSPDPLLSTLQNIQNIRQIMQARMRVTKELFQKETWDHFFVVFEEIDSLQHIGYTYSVEGAKGPEAQAMADLFEELDGYLAWFMEHQSADTVLLIASDHGFTKVKGLFYVNVWLEKLGLLKTRFTSAKKSEVQYEQIKETTQLVGNEQVSKLAQWFFSKRFFRPLIRRAYPLVKKIIQKDIRPAYATGIDFEQSLAFCKDHNTHGVYLNDARFSHGKQENRTLASRIKEELLKVIGPNGEKIVEQAWLREEVYTGPHIEGLPDVVFELMEGFVPLVDLDAPMVESINRETGDHHRNGILALWGAGIKPNPNRDIFDKAPRVFSIFDVAPTLLHLHGIGPDADSDGRILGELFEFVPEKRKGPTEETRIKHRLEHLKKIGKI